MLEHPGLHVRVIRIGTDPFGRERGTLCDRSPQDVAQGSAGKLLVIALGSRACSPFQGALNPQLLDAGFTYDAHQTAAQFTVIRLQSGHEVIGCIQVDSSPSAHQAMVQAVIRILLGGDEIQGGRGIGLGPAGHRPEVGSAYGVGIRILVDVLQGGLAVDLAPSMHEQAEVVVRVVGSRRIFENRQGDGRVLGGEAGQHVRNGPVAFDQIVADQGRAQDFANFVRGGRLQFLLSQSVCKRNDREWRQLGIALVGRENGGLRIHVIVVS